MLERKIGEQYIDAFLRQPNFQLTYRHALYTVNKMKKAKCQNDVGDILYAFVNERGFLFKYSMDYGFFRSVKKNEFKTSLYWNELRKLCYLVLLDLLHPEKATPSNAERKSQELLARSGQFENNWVPISNFQRIRKMFPELFLRPNKINKTRGKRRDDQRIKRYSTIFSQIPEIDEKDRDHAFLLMMLEHFSGSSHLEEMQEQSELMTGLLTVDPEDLECLQRFWMIVKHCLAVLNRNYGQPSENLWLIEHINAKTRVLASLYHYIDLAIILRTAKTIKSENKKWLLAYQNLEANYSIDDAKKAVELLVRWVPNQIETFNYVVQGARAYSSIGNHDIAIDLLNEIYNKNSLTGQTLGLYYRNVGAIYREKREYKNSIGYLKKALGIYQQINSSYDEAITWSFIASTYFLMQKPEKFREAVIISYQVLSKAKVNDILQAKAYLWFDECAQSVQNRDWEKECVTLGFYASAKLDDVSYSDYFWERLKVLNALRWCIPSKFSKTKIERPPNSDIF
jgi:tetratricopeptide (TPR) repeat protein